MQLWKRWSRKLDGWVERRRRFQNTSSEKTAAPAGQRVPAVAGVTVPTKVLDSGKAR
jgi:hypothetical protein